jgi:predicted acyltransferase
MIGFLKRNKIFIIVLLTDLFLYWFLFYSGVVLPFINPSVEEYNNTMTSFPRNASQMFIWIFMHFPTSYILLSITKNDMYLFLLVIQTSVIAYFIEKFIQRKRSSKIK